MTPDQAREKIRTHIKIYGRRRVVVTQKLITRWWNLLNIAVFYSKIPLPQKIDIRKLRGYFGECLVTSKGHKCSLIIEQDFSTKGLFLDVLVHEMVHCWEGYHHGTMGHSKRFYEWKPRIKRTVGLELENDYIEPKQ